MLCWQQWFAGQIEPRPVTGGLPSISSTVDYRTDVVLAAQHPSIIQACLAILYRPHVCLTVTDTTFLLRTVAVNLCFLADLPLHLEVIFRWRRFMRNGAGKEILHRYQWTPGWA